MPTIRAQLVCHSPERLAQILAPDANLQDLLSSCTFYPLNWSPEPNVLLGEVTLHFEMPARVVNSAIAGLRAAQLDIDAKAERSKNVLRGVEQSLLAIGWEGKA